MAQVGDYCRDFSESRREIRVLDGRVRRHFATDIALAIMINRATFLEIYKQAMRPMVARMDQAKWDVTRGVTLGCAGLSVAIIFVVTQTEVVGFALNASLFCASLAVPVWLAVWRVGEAYAFFGPESYAHFAEPGSSGLGLLLFLFGGLLLLISFVTLIWHFSVVSAVAFLIASVGMVVFTIKHQSSVQAWISRQEKNDG